MSRLSELFERVYGRKLTESAFDLLKRYAGDAAGELGDVARTVIAALDDMTLTGSEKRQIARQILKYVAGQLGLNLPGWLIDFVIQHVLAELRGNKEFKEVAGQSNRQRAKTASTFTFPPAGSSLDNP